MTESRVFHWQIKAPSQTHLDKACAHQKQLTKPQGSLGCMEDIPIWLAGLQASDTPQARPAEAMIFAADHPIAELGVSAFPSEVTAAMVMNLCRGGAAASVLCNKLNLNLGIIDVGVDTNYSKPEASKVANPSRRFVHYPSQGVVGDLVNTPAMSELALAGAAQAGINAVESLPKETKLLIPGEMGIGNTSCASALLMGYLKQHPKAIGIDETITAQDIIGPGTGLEAQGIRHKIEVIQKAVDRATSASSTTPLSAVECLRELGGREIAAMIAAMGCAAEKGIGILVDGLIVSSAALIGCWINPALRDWLCFTHQSAEPGHSLILKLLNAQPVLKANMRLGEASGALMFFPLLELAVACHNQMATFGEAQVPTAKVDQC